MRRKIWRMSEDRFDRAPGQIIFEYDSLDLSAVEKEPFSSTLFFSSASGDVLRGMVFSSNPYVVVKNPSFEGEKITVSFAVINAGAREGDVISGDFCVIWQGGSKDIPYTITYRAKELVCEDTAIHTPADFATFYRTNPRAALSLFHSADFLAFACRQDKAFELLVRGYQTFPKTFENLEEFLTGAGLKDRVTFSLSDSSLTYTAGEETLRESLDITKNTWGFISINVSADADFLTVGHSHITDDFFVGSVMHFDFYIHPDRMHAGKNYCRITFRSMNEEKTLTVLCRKEGRGQDADDRNRILQRSSAGLTKEYISYRFGQTETADWCDRSLALLDRMEEVSESPLSARLMKTHALIVAGRRQEALALVEDLKTDIVDKRSFEWAYLLYLCTMIEKEKDYVDRLTREVENIFRERQDDARVFWLLLFLRDEYTGNALKELSDIRQFVMAGVDSPFLYIEALGLMKRDPLLIKSFDPFTVRILRWAARKGRLTGNISMRISSLLAGEKSFSSTIFYIVSKAYSVNPSPELLDSALKYLLRNSVHGPDALPWYDLAIKAGLSLTGLYEAYVMSLPEDYARPLPEDVIRYFSYSNTISYDRRAFVFANMIACRETYVSVYEETKKTVEAFALEMMRHRRLDENLAVIYQDVLNRGIIDSDVAGMMAYFLTPCRIVSMPKNVRRAVIFTDASDAPLFVPVIRDRAYAPIPCRDYAVFLEKDGSIYVSDRGFILTEPVMDLSRLLPRLSAEAKDPLPYFLDDLNRAESAADLPEGAAEAIALFLKAPDIRYAYKAGRYSLLIDYLKNVLREDIFEDYLLKETDYSGMDTRTISYIIDLYVIGEKYDEAYRLLTSYYGMGVTGRSLLTVTTEMIRRAPESVDDFLVSMAAYLMSQYLSNEVTISCLGDSYVGPVRVMDDIYRRLLSEGLPGDRLLERAVTEILYTEEFPPDAEEIFEAYLSGHPNRMIAEAWFTYWTHRYMKTGDRVPASVFTHLAGYYRLGEKLNESCLVGLLKHCCTKAPEDEAEKDLLQDLLSEAIRKNLYFGFYREISDDLKIRFHLYDKYFVTYEGEEGQRIDIRLLNGSGDSLLSEMVEMYPGLYVCQLVLFFGDRSAYEVVYRDQPDQVLSRGEISCTDGFTGRETSRYGLINSMLSGLVYWDDRQVTDDMKKYKALAGAAGDLFSLR